MSRVIRAGDSLVAWWFGTNPYLSFLCEDRAAWAGASEPMKQARIVYSIENISLNFSMQIGFTSA